MDNTGSKKRRHSDTDDDSESICAEIGLEYYNKENGTSYELAGTFLLSNEFISDGTWVHCNFTAKQPDGDMNGQSPRRLFFAEMYGGGMTKTWEVTCCRVLEGSTTAGCRFCSDVVHPTHGFSQGHDKPASSTSASVRPASPTPYVPASSMPYMPPTSYMSEPGSAPSNGPLSPDADWMERYKEELSKIHFDEFQYAEPTFMEPAARNREYAKAAVENYNYENDTKYELVDVVLGNDVPADKGGWHHINFTAKTCDGDTSPTRFFAEVCGGADGVTACHILEGETIVGCKWCSEVEHPALGFSSCIPTYEAPTSSHVPELRSDSDSDTDKTIPLWGLLF